MLGSQAALLESGCDYLTVTSKYTDEDRPERLKRLQALAESDLLAERGRGNELKPWSWMGYSGFISGSVQLGKRHDTYIARISSHVARERYLDYLGSAQNVTRLDWQATYCYESVPEGWARALKDEAEAYKQRHDKRREVKLIESANHGDSVYIGERTGEVLVRVYDKHRESKRAYPEGSVRMEGEYKGEQAKRMAKHLRESAAPEADGLRRLRYDLTRRGVFPPASDSVPYKPVRWNVLPHGLVSTSDVGKVLRWLGRQCPKGFDLLRRHGMLIEGLRAVGITDDEVIRLGELLAKQRRRKEPWR